MERDDVAVLAASTARPELFEVIFDRYHGRIWQYLARRGGTQRADDLAGEVFLTAFAHRSRYDPERGPVSAWLYGIASRRLHDHLRRDARAGRALARVASRLTTATAQTVEGATDGIDARAHLDRVASTLRRLAPSDREVILLYAWDRLSYEEIAAVTGTEVGTVRSRLSRARRRLREQLDANDEVLVTTDHHRGGS